MNKKLPVSVSLAIMLIAMTVTFSITWLVSMNRFEQTVSSVTQLQTQYSKLAEIDNYVRSNYYGDIDDDHLFDLMAEGYINGIGDEYSVYYTADEYARMMDMQEGRIMGIGIEVVRETDGRFSIARVYEGSPAERAGVRAGGVIDAVDGISAELIPSISELNNLLWGEPGTEIKLVCLYNLSEEESFSVQRIEYTAPTVESIYLSDYAYIRISEFTDRTFSEFDAAIRTARNLEVKGILFDVRGNSEGSFSDAYDIIDMICPIGTIAQSEGLNGVRRVRATSDENELGLPMAVLVNGETSAAAELFAVSIRDLAGGQIVGTQTKGHGTYQTSPFRLPDGSAVVVTDSVLWTGADETFDVEGLVPDVETVGGDVGALQLITPNPQSDSQILRGFEVLRSMVRELGQDPGEAITGEMVPATSDTTSTTDDSSASTSTSDDSSASTSTSTSDDSSTSASTSEDDEDSSASTSADEDSSASVSDDSGTEDE